jgi:hypothetical protein
MAFAGLVRWAAGAPTESDLAESRQSGAPPAALAEKVRQLPKNLPSTAKLVVGYQVNSPDLISVLIVEVESMADIQWLNSYYSGWFQISWHPTNVVARD